MVVAAVVIMKDNCILRVDFKELAALQLLPTLLPAPMVRFKARSDDEGEHSRKRNWKPTVVEMMAACIVVVPVSFHLLN